MSQFLRRLAMSKPTGSMKYFYNGYPHPIVTLHARQAAAKARDRVYRSSWAAVGSLVPLSSSSFFPLSSPLKERSVLNASSHPSPYTHTHTHTERGRRKQCRRRYLSAGSGVHVSLLSAFGSSSHVLHLCLTLCFCCASRRFVVPFVVKDIILDKKKS